jgi:hypothetical protein
MQQNEPELALVAGEQSVQNLGHLLETDLDPEVQRDARSVRADLLLMMGRLREAEDGLLELWRRFPADSVGQDAGLRAAQLAEHQPGEAGRADSILSALRRGASNATVRRALGLGGAPAPGASGGRR